MEGRNRTAAVAGTGKAAYFSDVMGKTGLFGVLRAVCYVVLAAMAVALTYAIYTVLANWAHIAV